MSKILIKKCYFAFSRPQQNDYFRNISAFNYLQPNFKSIPQKTLHVNDDNVISSLHERQLSKQQQFVAEKREKEKKSKKSKKEKSTKHAPVIREDKILMKPSNIASPRHNIPPKHDYQNLEDEHRKLSSSQDRRSQERKIICGIRNGVYYFNASNQSSLTSFAEIEQKKSYKENIANDSAFIDDGKMKNFSLSKYLNIDMKSVSPDSASTSTDKSDKSSSLSNKSVESVEQSIIRNGLKKNLAEQNSYLGPFNFRKLLRPTGKFPTESLRKRKGTTSSPPPDKSFKTKA